MSRSPCPNRPPVITIPYEAFPAIELAGQKAQGIPVIRTLKLFLKDGRCMEDFLVDTDEVVGTLLACAAEGRDGIVGHSSILIRSGQYICKLGDLLQRGADSYKDAAVAETLED